MLPSNRLLSDLEAFWKPASLKTVKRPVATRCNREIQLLQSQWFLKIHTFTGKLNKNCDLKSSQNRLKAHHFRNTHREAGTQGNTPGDSIGMLCCGGGCCCCRFHIMKL